MLTYTLKYMKHTKIILIALLLTILLASCRTETQNRIRRDIQNLTGERFEITLYDQNGEPIFTGIVNGKVSRSSAYSSNNNEKLANGSYIYWYDEKGRYYQTDLSYLLVEL